MEIIDKYIMTTNQANKGVKATTNKTPTMNAVNATPQEAKNKENTEFTREMVESLGKQVSVVDVDPDSGLELFCYLKCTNTDSELLKQCRGVVFNKNELIFKGSYTNEYNHTEVPLLEEALQNFSKFSFFDSHEGCLLRVFNFKGKFYLSTHRKLNAFKSKWSSKESFGTLFKKALVSEVENNRQLRSLMPPTDADNVLEQFYSILSPEKQYLFLVLNDENNRIVCKPSQRPTLYHVGTFTLGDPEVDLDDNSLPIPKPRRHTWLNIDELLGYVENIDPSQLQGVIGFGPNNTQLKVLHKEYQDLFRARGNEPSVKFRYLQVRMTKKFVDMLYYLYPNCADTFDDYENTLFEIARSIYRSYVKRFIKKIYVTVHPDEFQVIKDCHNWHLTDRENNRISIERVIAILNKQPPTSLNHMIRRFKIEQSKKNEEHDEIQFPRMVKGTPVVAPLEVLNGTPVSSPLLLNRNEVRNPPKLEL